jgi:hypothetical protein
MQRRNRYHKKKYINQIKLKRKERVVTKKDIRLIKTKESRKELNLK